MVKSATETAPAETLASWSTDPTGPLRPTSTTTGLGSHPLPGGPEKPRLKLNPQVPNQLAGAFAKLPGTTGPTLAAQTPLAWQGPIATPATLGELGEQWHLLGSKNSAVVLPYKDFDPKKPPVILVHGLLSPGANFLDELADQLYAQGNQVLIVYYRDAHNDPKESGRGLALELAHLREAYYPAGTPVDIVGLCIGGVVIRSALNDLQEPTWGEGSADPRLQPRAGFGTIRLRTVDTMWDGFFHEPEEDRAGWFTRLVSFVLGAFGVGGTMELRATSDTFAHLHDVQLQGVEFQNYAIRKPADATVFRGVPQYDPGEAHELARFLAHGEPPKTLRLRNFSRALAADSRFAALRADFRARVEAQQLALERPSAALQQAVVDAYLATMPPFTVLGAPDAQGKRQMRSALASHVLAMVDDKARTDDVVDVLASELRPGARPAGR